MRLSFLLISSILLFVSCNSFQQASLQPPIQSIRKEILFKDSISIRALEVSAEKIWFAGSSSTIGVVDMKSKVAQTLQLKTELPVEFRSLARNNQHLFALSIGNPAQLYRFSPQLENNIQVYKETHEKVFYDALSFIDSLHGIAIGDPTDESLAILLTQDGGATWKRIPENNAPKLVSGEAAFAASNTNIVVQGQTIWVITGGKKSRLWKSIDFGQHWNVTELPIIQGEAMTGAFTAAFYDENIGVVAGGDYANPMKSEGNIILTRNAGRDWERRVGQNSPTYISCIQFVPSSKGRELITVGAGGMFYSNDQGQHWQLLDSDSKLYTIRFIDSETLIAAGKNKIVAYKLLRK